MVIGEVVNIAGEIAELMRGLEAAVPGRAGAPSASARRAHPDPADPDPVGPRPAGTGPAGRAAQRTDQA